MTYGDADIRENQWYIPLSKAIISSILRDNWKTVLDRMYVSIIQ